MAKLRRRAMFGFWAVSLLPLLGSQLMAFIMTEYLFDKDKWSITGASLLMDSLILYIPFNLPDIVSLIIYLNMVRYFNKRVEPQPNFQEAEIEQPYGGVWVGDVLEDDLEASSSNLPEEVTINNYDSETKSILVVLRRHVSAGFVDVSIVVTSYWFCSSLVGKPLAYFCQLAMGYWVPLIVIRSSFKQLS